MKKELLTRSISIEKDLQSKIQQEAERDCSSFNAVVRKILKEYFKNK